MVRFGTDPQRARIKTGTYTGDGSTSQAITGVGFQPMLVLFIQNATVDAGINYFVGVDQFGTNKNAQDEGGAWYMRSDRVISLDSDGFTVDDSGLDYPPNKNGEEYVYIAFG